MCTSHAYHLIVVSSTDHVTFFHTSQSNSAWAQCLGKCTGISEIYYSAGPLPSHLPGHLPRQAPTWLPHPNSIIGGCVYRPRLSFPALPGHSPGQKPGLTPGQVAQIFEPYTAPYQSSAISFAVVIFLSGQTGGELCVMNKLSQSVRRRFTILRFSEIFVFSLSSFSSVFVGCYCRYGLSVTR